MGARVSELHYLTSAPKSTADGPFAHASRRPQHGGPNLCYDFSVFWGVNPIAALLPDHAPYVTWFALMGFAGGVAAAANKADYGPREIVRRSIIGLVVGLTIGCVGLAYLGAEEKSFWYTAAACSAGGFMGPIYLLQLVKEGLPKSFSEKLFKPPQPPPDPPIPQPRKENP